MNATLPISLFDDDDSLFVAGGDFDVTSAAGEPMSGDCNYLPLISVYHDGELSDPQTAELEGHLPHCAACRSELEQLRELSGSIRAIDLPKMPVTSRLRLRKQASVYAVAGRVRFVRTLTAVAASIFLIAGSMLMYLELRPTGVSHNPVVNPAGTDGKGSAKPLGLKIPDQSSQNDSQQSQPSTDR